jgi:8-oxo-dGTP pyrophosphatase MutT (NUDIX family)
LEKNASKEKFTLLKNGTIINGNICTLDDLLNESNKYTSWIEPEWGFPKGRRNTNENDYQCALREFSEETGYNIDDLKNIQNIYPFEETFMGSNYKTYKHKYYLMYMDYDKSLSLFSFENSEVSKISWKTYEECIKCIRPYNLEKLTMIKHINDCLLKNKIFY